jgi:predicted phosphodiesterase
MDFVAGLVERERPDVVAHAGDWVERASTHEDRDFIFGWCQRVAAVCPVTTVEGNHEEPGLVSELSRLASVHRIEAATRAGVALVGGVAWALMPWPSRASIAAHAEALFGAVPSGELVTETANALLERILRTLGAMLDQFGPDVPRVLLIHAEPATYSTDPDQPDHVAQGMRVSVEDMVRLVRVSAALVGHIHLPQHFDVVRDDGVSVPVILIGSPRRTAYAKGELVEKGVVRVRFDGARLLGWERIPTPATPMRLVEAHWTGTEFLSTDLIGLEAHDLSGHEIRLRYTVAADQREAADREAESLRTRLLGELGALDVKLDPVTEPVTRARAPEVATAPTLREKIEATWDAMGDSGPEEARRPRLLELAMTLAAEGAAA